MTIQERLRTLEIDPLFKVSLNEDVSKSWQRNNDIKLPLAKEIRDILREIYEPMGLWNQNPKTDKLDIGVIIDDDWSPLMQADTNYSCHCMIFNRCNKFLVSLFRKKGIEEITIDGEVFSYKNQIVFHETDSVADTNKKIKSILKIVRYKKNDIFLIGSEMYNELIKLFNKTMGIGDEAQKFYEKDIHFFFDDIIEYKSTKGRGDYDDRKEGVDIWKTHKDRKTTDQIKSICNVEPKNDGYFIDVSMSRYSRCDYYVFVCIDKRILIFKNDKTKIIFQNNGVFFPNELLHKQKLYNE